MQLQTIGRLRQRVRKAYTRWLAYTGTPMATQGEAARSVSTAGSATGADDLDLARRALAGAADARSELGLRMVCVPRMLAALNARLGRPLGPHDLEDLTQDVLVALWRGLPAFAGLSSLESWIFRSCHRALMARVRHLPSRNAATGGQGPEPIAPAQAQAFEEIHRALEQLELRSRRVIELKHFEELTFEEIGARLSSSPNTVKAWYYQTIAELRRILEPSRRGADG